MRITITVDDTLMADAERLTGLIEGEILIREALIALVQRESARQLARRGGSEREARYIPRRRPAAE